MPASITSPQQVRDRNAAVVLGSFWDAPADTGLTASELVETMGLTRATVLAICDDLRERGWVTEDRAPRSAPGRGRQARRFTFDRTRTLVAAADVGVGSVTAVVADLKGTVLGRSRHSFGGREWEVDRTDHLIATLEEALEAAGETRERVEAACIGVAAPVDAEGAPFPGNPFWDLVRIDLPRVAGFAPGWRVAVENDADLAALAELHAAGVAAARNSITLLATERFGAGIVVNGGLMRGDGGGAGEMSFLERVAGVGTSLGIANSARVLVREGLAAGRPSVLRAATGADGVLSMEAILAAAVAGDELAVAAVEHEVERLAVTVSTLATLLDPGRVIIAGGIAQLVDAILPDVRARVAELAARPPVVVASTLGRDVVLVGAVRGAIERLRRDVLRG